MQSPIKEDVSMEDKSFINLARAIPKLAYMEQTGGLIQTFLKQWGLMNTFRILFKTGKKTGHLKTLKYLLNFRLDRLTPNFLVSMWEVFEDREAIISEGRRYTYGDLRERVFRLANALQSLGLQPKDRCAELLCNGNEFFEAFFACSLIGCPMPFINWHSRGEELALAIEKTQPRVLILHDTFLDEIIPLRHRLPSIEHYIVVGENNVHGTSLYEMPDPRTAVPCRLYCRLGTLYPAPRHRHPHEKIRSRVVPEDHRGRTDKLGFCRTHHAGDGPFSFRWY
ncbi:MAG TPA: hypothetical protein ENN05_13160 [Deltaproteobacteria bacterium]|nr:hypothetical protein [Deltaproteobacteria bacterium]